MIVVSGWKVSAQILSTSCLFSVTSFSILTLVVCLSQLALQNSFSSYENNDNSSNFLPFNVTIIL